MTLWTQTRGESLAREPEASDAAQPGLVPSPSTLSLSALVDHIEQTHHAYLHRELPRLTGLIEKVVRAHGASHPYLIELEASFRLFRDELEHHLFKEERILFPWIRRRETEPPAQLATEPLHAGPIHLLEAEHDEARKALVAFRHLTNNYTPPADACGTFRALLEALAALEQDMHRHVHLENSILFPRDLALEAALK